LEVIRRDVATDQVRVDNPTQNLESYFLDVVQKARAAQETSGAQSGARVAEYLRAGAGEKPATDKILEKLALPDVKPAPVAAATVKAAPAADEKKLEGLTKASEPAASPAKPASPAAKPADLSKADEKLSSLLGGKS
jgi:murein tripeptide amidase MpaA